MGRPKLAKDEPTERLGFTLPLSLAGEFKCRARVAGLSQSEYFRLILELTREIKLPSG